MTILWWDSKEIDLGGGNRVPNVPIPAGDFGDIEAKLDVLTLDVADVDTKVDIVTTDVGDVDTKVDNI